LAESFEDRPREATSKKVSEEEVQEKMKIYMLIVQEGYHAGGDIGCS
jgi:hypothetical protein